MLSKPSACGAGKVFIAAALCANSIYSFGDQWILVSEGSQGTTWIETSTFERRGPVAKLYQLLNKNRPDADGYQSYIYLVEFHCANGVYRLLSSTAYVGAVARGPSVGPSTGPPTEWKHFGPAGSDMLRRVCAPDWLSTIGRSR